TRRWITLLAVGWFPPAWPPSGACLHRGTRGPWGLFTLPRVTPHRGCASAERGEQPHAACPLPHRHREACGGTTPCLALAPRQALPSRARATTPCWAGFPLASNGRAR